MEILILSTLLSSVAYDEMKSEKSSSVVEVDFTADLNSIIRAKKPFVRDSFSNHFAAVSEAVVEVRGTITISF